MSHVRCTRGHKTKRQRCPQCHTVLEWDSAMIEVEESWRVCACVGGLEVRVIYTNKLIAAVPSVLRETLSSCLCVNLWPQASSAGHLQLHQTGAAATAPPDCCYVTASELHASQVWELIGHFMSESLSQPLTPEVVNVIIKASLQLENWLKW